MELDKKKLSERDICTKFITPAIVKAGWDIQTQVLEEKYFTDGRISVRGKTVKRGDGKRADYILYHKPNQPLAIIEAKDNKQSISDGMQQALNYAETLHIPFVFSSNGDGFQFHDRTGQSDQLETQLSLAEFPTPQDLWRKYCKWKNLDDWKSSLVEQDYYDDGSGKTPRYYQANAINRTIESIANGNDRALLLMATGTGKTYTAFQIIWRLWKAGFKKRILFLADRNILVDQTKTNDFKPFGNAMTKVSGKKIDKSYEIFLSLYQAITGPNEVDKAFKNFSPDFFDLIVIDECHRGSAREDSQWREILDYFSEATHLGLTATPKETETVSSIDYFGKPAYEYSLKQGIDDGFLAPYRVVRIHLDVDLTGWRPPKGYRDKHDNEVEDRIYNQQDFDKNIVMEQRTQLVAHKIAEYLKGTDPYAKTIVFCHDIDHAERMRVALVNELPEFVKQNRKYVMRITGDEKEGKAELDNFIHPEERYPVIATTSQLMSTGVDARTCKLIVLDKAITSMIEFKQIIGRGTRIAEEYGKQFFTIMDLRNATDKFADPDFDGDPVQIYVATEADDVVPPEVEDIEYPEGELPPDAVHENPDVSMPTGQSPRGKYVVGDVEFKVAVEQVQYMDKDGRLITESLRDYTRNTMLDTCKNLDTFLDKWSAAEKKTAIVEALEEEGIFFDPLAELVGREYDPFDSICHVAYQQKPLTRRERADNVKKRDYFTKYGEQARKVLAALLDKYATAGIAAIETMKVLNVDPFDELGSVVEIVGFFGGKNGYLEAVRELEVSLYSAV